MGIFDLVVLSFVQILFVSSFGSVRSWRVDDAAQLLKNLNRPFKDGPDQLGNACS